MIEVDVEARAIRLDVPDREIAARLADYRPKPRHFERGYVGYTRRMCSRPTRAAITIFSRAHGDARAGDTLS